MTEVRPADVAEPSAHDPEEAARRLVAITRDLAREVHPHRARALRATLDSSLDRDFGLDSLGRVELWGRLERAFEVRLPESLLSEARTPRDLLEVILKGGARPAAPVTQRVLHAAPGVVEPIPDSVTTLLEVLEWHVEAHPERTHLVLRADASGEEVISYRGLRDGARRVAAGLHARGHGPVSRCDHAADGRGFFGPSSACCSPAVPRFPSIRRRDRPRSRITCGDRRRSFPTREPPR
jgi:acyl carrier protein